MKAGQPVWWRAGLLTATLLAASSAPFSAPSATLASAVSGVPFRGTLTLEDYEVGASGGVLGLIDIALPGGQQTRVRDGAYPWRHPNGTLSFVQGCDAGGVNQVALDRSGPKTLISPCSSQVKNPDVSDNFPAHFEFSRLSPDAQKVAAEYSYLNRAGSRVIDVLVYDLKGRLLATFKNRSSPVWLPDGRLAMGGDGIVLTTPALQNPKRLGGEQLSGSFVGNMDVNPAGTQIAFEYNQQIWLLDLKSDTPRRAVTSNVILRYPAFSSDGHTLAYLGTSGQDFYVQQILFTDLKTNKAYSLAFTVNNTGLNRPNGPLSWNK